MKLIKLTLIALAFMLSIPANANEASCLRLYTFSGTVMKERQDNKPAYLLYIEVENSRLPANAKKLANKIIDRAYEVPVFFRASQREEITALFAEDVYKTCVENFH